MIKRFLIFFVILFCFFGCSNNSDNENTDIQTFYKIEYNQGSIIGNKTSYPGDFHKVYEYHCVDEGDLFYRIQNMNTYFFTASKYNADENLLLSMVKNKSKYPDVTEKNVTVRNVVVYITNSSNEECVLYSTDIIKYNYYIYQ